VLDKRVELQPLIAGGGHERGLRSGTENVRQSSDLALRRNLRRNGLPNYHSLASHAGEIGKRAGNLGARIFATEAQRLANTSYFAFPNIDGETLVGKLDREGFAVASGAACSSANPEPSHVLESDGRGAGNCPRCSTGEPRGRQYETEIDEFINALQATVGRLQGLTAMAA
jgi:cysteine desulfurase